MIVLIVGAVASAGIVSGVVPLGAVSAAPSLPPSPDLAGAGSGPGASIGAAAGPSTRPSATGSPRPSPAPSPVSSPAPPIGPVVAWQPPPVGPASFTFAVSTAELQAAVATWLRATGTPGASVTIRWADGHTWTGVAGFADLAGRVPVRPATAFAAASMTKTFVAALVLQLAATGRLRLDDPVTRWLDPAVVRAARASTAVSVRMLLDHTSGLSDFFFGPGVDAALQKEPDRAWSATDALAFVRKPYFAPGTSYHYSNTNYLLLGLIAERVTGRPLATELRARFLDPLGLTRTWYQAVEAPRAATANGYRFVGLSRTAAPIDVTDDPSVVPFRSVVTASGAAGSIASTSADLVRWATALYAGRVLPAGSLAASLAEAPLTAALGATVPYGLGVQVLRIGPFDTIGHGGSFLGFQGAVRYLPDARVTIAVLTNQSRYDSGVLVRNLLDIAIPLEPRCPVCG